MEILEMALWIFATPILLFIGFAWLGFILGLFSDPYYGIKDVQDGRREKRAKQIKVYVKNQENIVIHWEALAWTVVAVLAFWFVVLPLLAVVITFLTFTQEAEDEENDLNP